MKRKAETAVDAEEERKICKIPFQTRCNPKLVYKVVETLKFRPQFRKVVTNMGLEALLNLRIARLQRELCADLARRVDVKRSMLVVHGREIPLNYPTVTKILGLPCIGYFSGHTEHIEKEEALAVCARFNLHSSGRISFYSLLEFLNNATEFDKEFQAKFLLFSIATMLRPTTNVQMYYREFIPLLGQLHKLQGFNWAKFVLDGLLHSIASFQSKCSNSLVDVCCSFSCYTYIAYVRSQWPLKLTVSSRHQYSVTGLMIEYTPYSRYCAKHEVSTVTM